MVLTINQRLNDYQKLKKFSWEELRIKLGLKNAQQISSWSNLKERIPEKHIIKIIELFPDLDARWFITGEGVMLGGIKYSEQIESHTSNNDDGGIQYACSNPACRAQINAMQKTIDVQDELLRVYRGESKKKAVG